LEAARRLRMKRAMRSKRMMRKGLSTWMINTDVDRCR
jgi:hypothetical protein